MASPTSESMMAAAPVTATGPAPAGAGGGAPATGATRGGGGRPGGDLQALAQRHLWMHFTRMGAYADHEVPVIVRGEGCYVYDEHGKRYLDGLSALYCVNIGHGRAELGEAAARQAKELGVLHQLELRAPPLDRAGDADRAARPGQPQPRVLHLGRLGGRGERVEAREGLPRRARGARPVQDRSRATSPTTGPRWARSQRRGCRRCASRSSR